MKIKIPPTHRPNRARGQDLRQAVGRRLACATVLAMLLAAPVRADDMADVSKLLRSGKVAEALGKTNEYLAKHPADPQMRFMKGVLLTEQNKNEEAIAVFTKLTEDYRDLPEPYNNLAVLYAAGGQYEKARITLEKAIRTNPSYMTAYENLGDVYGKMASQAYDKALALGSSSTPAKSKLTLLRTFSSSTGAKVTVPEQVAPPVPAMAAAPARPPATAQVQLISPIPADAGKSQPPQRIPALSVTPPAAAVKPAPVVAAAPAKPDPAIAKAEAAKLEAAKAEAARLAKVEAAKAESARLELAKLEAAKQAKADAAKAELAKREAAKQAKADAVKAELAKVEAAKQAKSDAAKALLAKQEADKLAQADAAKIRLAKVDAAKQAKADAEKAQLAKAEVAKQEKVEAAKLAKAEPAKLAKADNGDRDAVLGQVHGWAKAWAAQNVDSYLGYYSSEFEPPKGLSRKAWSDERRARIEGKGRIHVEITAPEVVVTGNTAKVTFRQTYVSDRLTARSHKTLMLVKNGGKWQIKQESSGS